MSLHFLFTMHSNVEVKKLKFGYMFDYSKWPWAQISHIISNAIGSCNVHN